MGHVLGVSILGISDCHGAALVAADGNIDWATLHRFDVDPVCCRRLDDDRGRFWSLHPRGAWILTRAYLPGTNILRTVFSMATGEVTVTDFMPVGRQLGARVSDYVRLNAPAWIVRRIKCLRDAVAMETAYRLSRAFALKRVTLAAEAGVIDAGPRASPSGSMGSATALRRTCVARVQVLLKAEKNISHLIGSAQL